MLENDTKHEHNEMMRDKMRKISMCGDQDRIMNSNLIDKMATIAGQIALVARMGDENSDTMNDMTDDLDDRYDVGLMVHYFIL